MLDYQRIVDDIRSLIGTHDAEEMDFLRAAAADYSVACDEVCERLTQCGALLRQGLRSEAIQLCEIEPNLLDIVALLDFPEYSAWIETANRCGIATPPALPLDVAASLNEAYALEQPLAALLQQHRLLALTHGTLQSRIQVMQRLAELDGNNPVWQEDLAIFEKERQKQLQTEVEAAVRAGDSDALVALDAELSGPQWRNPPPPELAKLAAESHTRLRYWTVQSQFEQLAKELESARSGFRVKSGQAARDRWNQLVATSGWQAQEQVAARAAPAFEWLADQDRIEERKKECEGVLSDLSKAAGHGNSLAELQDLHTRAIRLGTVPPELEERCQSRLAVLQRASRRRRWLQIAGIAGAVVLVVAAIGWFISYELREQQVAEAEKNLPFMIEHGQIEEAQALAQGLSDAVRQDARVRKFVDQLEESFKKEKTRRAEFSQQLHAANHWLERLLASLANESGQTVLARQYEELQGIEKDVQRARTLARTEAERAEVSKVAEFASQVQSKWQGQIDKAFLAEYEDRDGQLTKMDSDGSAKADSQKTRVRDFAAQLRKWEVASDHVTPALLTRIASLKERLAGIEKAVQQQSRSEQAEQQVTAAVGDIRGYLKAIRDYMQENPGSDQTGYFRRSSEESLCWQAMAEWNKLAEQLHRTRIVELDAAAANEQLPPAKSIADAFSESGPCACIRRLLPYLQAIADRNDGGEPIDVPLKKLFAARSVADVWMVETDDGQRYYATEQPDRNSPFQYITGFDGKTRGKRLTASEAEKAKIGRAPQVAIAEQIQPILKNLEDRTWEKSFCRMVSVIQSDHNVDPILKLNLLQQLLQAGARGSHCLEKAFGRHLQYIKGARVNAFANWLDPTDAAASTARKDADKVLRQFPDIADATKAAAQDFLTLRRQSPMEYRWVGWLHATKSGQWECLMKEMPKETGKLFIVYRPTTDSKPAMATVGRLDQGTSTIDATTPTLLVAGRPIYLEVP